MRGSGIGGSVSASRQCCARRHVHHERRGACGASAAKRPRGRWLHARAEPLREVMRAVVTPDRELPGMCCLRICSLSINVLGCRQRQSVRCVLADVGDVSRAGACDSNSEASSLPAGINPAPRCPCHRGSPGTPCRGNIRGLLRSPLAQSSRVAGLARIPSFSAIACEARRGPRACGRATRSAIGPRSTQAMSMNALALRRDSPTTAAS